MFHLFVFVVKDRRLVAIREFSLKENLEEASLAWREENLRQLLPKKSKWKNVSYLKSWRQALPIAPSPMMTSFLVMTSCLSVSLSAISSAKTTLATLERANRNVLGRRRRTGQCDSRGLFDWEEVRPAINFLLMSLQSTAESSLSALIWHTSH